MSAIPQDPIPASPRNAVPFHGPSGPCAVPMADGRTKFFLGPSLRMTVAMHLLACNQGADSSDDAVANAVRLADKLIRAEGQMPGVTTGELDGVDSYVREVAQRLHDTHYPQVTDWEPAGDLLSLLTQIDRMTEHLESPDWIGPDAPKPASNIFYEDQPAEHLSRAKAREAFIKSASQLDRLSAENAALKRKLQKLEEKKDTLQQRHDAAFKQVARMGLKLDQTPLESEDVLPITVRGRFSGGQRQLDLPVVGRTYGNHEQIVLVNLDAVKSHMLATNLLQRAGKVPQ